MPQSRRMTIPFVGQESRSKSILVDAQVTQNFMAGRSAPGAKAPITLESIPGTVEVAAAGDGFCRSPHMVQWRGALYGVFGSHLVEFSLARGLVSIGTIGSTEGRVRLARGRRFLMLVDGLRGYTYDGTTLAEITDPDFPDVDLGAAPTHCVYIDGFFVVNDANADFFFISGIEDPTSWNALDFEAAAVAPDEATAIATTESELWIIGDETAQAFYNSGNALFPFQIILSATQEVGILAPQSIAESDAGIFYLATTPEGGAFVYQIRGHSGRKISGEQQDEQIAEITDPTGAFGFIYSQAGKSFYVLHLDETRTLVFNIMTQSWETRALDDGSAWRIAGMGVLGARNLGGSRFNSSLYELKRDVYTDAGRPIVRRRVTQIQHHNNHLIDWWEVVVDVDVQDVPPTLAPLILLRYSDDGGESWSQTLQEPLGQTGRRERRAVFRNLGSSRNRIFEVEVSDAVGVTLIAAYARIAVLED